MRQAKKATVRRRANRSPVALALAVCCTLALITSQAALAVSADAESRFQAEMGAVVSAVDTAPMGIFSKISLRGHLRSELRKNHASYPEQPMPVEAIKRVIGRLAEMKVETRHIAQAAAALDLAAKTGASAEMVSALSDTLTGGTKAEAQEVIGAYAHINTELRARAEGAGGSAVNSSSKAQKLVRDAADLFRETLESGNEAAVHLVASAVAQARAQSIALGDLVTELRAAVGANLNAEALKTRVDQIMARLRGAVGPAEVSASGSAGVYAKAGAGSQASGEAGAGRQSGTAGAGLSAGAGASVSGSVGKTQAGAGGKAGLNVSVGAGAQ